MFFRISRGRWDSLEPAAQDVILLAQTHGIPILQMGPAISVTSLGERIICLIPTRYWQRAMEIDWFNLPEVKKVRASVIVVPVIAHSYDYARGEWVDHPVDYWYTMYSKIISVNPTKGSAAFKINYANLMAHFVLERDLETVMSPENFYGVRKPADTQGRPLGVDGIKVRHKIREVTGVGKWQLKVLERKFTDAAFSTSEQDNWVQHINMRVSTQKPERLMKLFTTAPYDSNWGKFVRSKDRKVFTKLPIDVLAAAITHQGFEPTRKELENIGAYAKPGKIRRFARIGLAAYMVPEEIQNTTYPNILQKMVEANVWCSSISLGNMQLALIPADLKIKLAGNFWSTSAFQELKQKIVTDTQNPENSEKIDEIFKTMTGWVGTLNDLEELLRAVL